MKDVIIEGIIQGNEKGFGFLIPVSEEFEDFFISHGDLRGAMHQDRVLAQVSVKEGRGFARVLKILERGINEIVGTYRSVRGGGFVVPDDKKYFCDIFVLKGREKKAKSGDKVVCKIINYPKNTGFPEGIVKEVLGKQFSRLTEIKCIQRAFGLEDCFPKKVLEQVESFDEPKERDFVGRKDFTNDICVTIDGEDSKDFDDAVSLEKNKQGEYVLGIHIADVSHYVKSGSFLDSEAYKRGTSAYFPENVIPMLPEKLCNNLCSLNPNKTRLTLSCIVKLDNKGNVLDYEICKSMIKSKARLTYNVVQKIIDKDKSVIKEYSFIASKIFLMDELATVLIDKRENSGAIDLDVKDSLVTVNERNDIIIMPAPRDKAHKLIEEFMVLANTCVAEKLFELTLPGIYRVHEKPSDEKYAFLLTFLHGLGYDFEYKQDVSSFDYKKILEKSRCSSAYNVINRVMLRSMQKAKYSEICKGHFGLAEKFYCHFTSPIRRYPDLFVHRVLKDYMKQGETFVVKKYGAYAKSVAQKSSEAEKNVAEAERSADDFYKLLYIEKHIGEEFSGIISGVKKSGVFVELENTVEGFVNIENLMGTGLIFDSENFRLHDNVYSYNLGDSVKIKVVGINLTERKAEFLLCEKTCKKN